MKIDQKMKDKVKEKSNRICPEYEREKARVIERKRER